MSPTISCTSVYKIFGDNAQKLLSENKGKVDAAKFQEAGCIVGVNDASFDVNKGEMLVVMGLSGSGKSTLLRLIAGLEKPDAGSIFINGQNVVGMPPHQRGLGIVQQNYALFPHMTVQQNVEFGLRWREENPVTDEKELARRVGATLELVGLNGFENRGVGQISGGQMQRVSLARTLVTEPKVCLLDEPLGALDANLRERMTLELRRIRDTLGVSFLHVTGNENDPPAHQFLPRTSLPD